MRTGLLGMIREEKGEGKMSRLLSFLVFESSHYLGIGCVFWASKEGFFFLFAF